MDRVRELLIVADKRCNVYDVDKGTRLFHYTTRNLNINKTKGFNPKTVSQLTDYYMIGAIDKHLCVWSVQGHEARNMIISLLPGPVSVLIVSSCTRYCALAIGNCVYLYQVLSGKVLGKTSFCEQDVSSMRFSSDSQFVLIGYKSGRLVICLLSELVARNGVVKAKPDIIRCDYHTLEITDIYPGCFDEFSKVATTSYDMTCKLTEMSTGDLICSICLDMPLMSVLMDPIQSLILIGDDEGNIIKVNLIGGLPREAYFDDKMMTKVKAHSTRAISMSFSLEGNKFLSASQNECKMWNLDTMESRTVLTDTHITNAYLSRKPGGMMFKDLEVPFKIPVFKRDYDELVEEGSGEIPTRVRECFYRKKKLTHDLGISKVFDKTIVRNGDAVSVKSEDLSMLNCKFMTAFNTEDVQELRAVNHQLYTHMLRNELERVGEPSCKD